MNSEPPIDPKVCINPASAVVADSTEGTPRPKYRPTKTGKRNESSLIAFDKVIRNARNQNSPVSYTKICKLLLEKHNVKVARNTVFNYVKVRSKEPTYYKMTPSSVPYTELSRNSSSKEPSRIAAGTDMEAIRRAQWEEKKRVDESRAANEAFLKAEAIAASQKEKRTFTFDASKPIEIRRPQP